MAASLQAPLNLPVSEVTLSPLKRLNASRAHSEFISQKIILGLNNLDISVASHGRPR